MAVREAARSAARELGYRDLKSEQLKVVETFAKWRDIYFCCGYLKVFVMSDCV